MRGRRQAQASLRTTNCKKFIRHLQMQRAGTSSPSGCSSSASLWPLVCNEQSAIHRGSAPETDRDEMHVLPAYDADSIRRRDPHETSMGTTQIASGVVVKPQLQSMQSL